MHANNRLTGDTGAVAQRQYNKFAETVDSKIGSKLVSRACTTPSQKAATKRSHSTPNRNSKMTRTEELQEAVTSPVARVTPPPAFLYYSARPWQPLLLV